MKAFNMFESSPIVMREVRARWRSGRPYWLVLVYATVIACVIGFVYGSNVVEVERSADTAIAGRELFRYLTWVQTLAWMLLAPALTAPVIAGEREQGLLEGLQLSPLRPGQIVRGKLFAALAFLAVMMLVPVPGIAICFLMGGLSPGEFGLALALQLAVAVAGAAVGLACSSFCHRVGSALSNTFSVVVLWNVISAVMLFVAATATTGGLNLWPGVRDICSVLGMTNPLVAVATITDPDTAVYLAKANPIFATSVVPLAYVSILFCLASTVVLLLFAAYKVRRPLAEQLLVELKPRRRKGKAARATTPAEPGSPAKPSRVRLELPLLWRIRFENPILQRELRSKLRQRQVSKATTVGAVLIVLFLVYLYIRLMILTIKEPMGRPDFWQIEMVVVSIGVLLASSLMGANALSREREAGTWEALNLSLLSRGQIVAGKLLAILLTCGAGVLLVSPLLLSCVFPYDAGRMNSVAPLTALVSLVVLGAAAWSFAAFGILLSWLCRRTVGALCWTIGSLIVVYVIGPGLVEWVVNEYARSDLHPFQIADPVKYVNASWHPVLALMNMADWPRYDDKTVAVEAALKAVRFHLVLGAILTVVAVGSMRRGLRERDGKFRGAIKAPRTRRGQAAAAAE